jgi:hypothetical protein
LFIDVSVAVPVKLHEYDMESAITDTGLTTQKRYTSLTSEQHAQTGKENERSKGTSALKYCDEGQLLSYLSKLQAINPESIVNMATMKGVNCVCR